MVLINNYTQFYLSAFVLVLISFFIVNKYVKNIGITTLLLIVKLGIGISYFAIWSEYKPILLRDDIDYFESSRKLYHYIDGNLLNLFKRETILYMGMLAGGSHFGFYIFNCVSFFLMGQSYFAPVFLNIFCSVLTTVFLYKLSLKLEWSKTKSLLFLTFLMIHWDLIAWSSFINLKDTVVLFLSTLAFYSMISIYKEGFKWKYFLAILLIIIVFLNIRYYFSYFIFLLSLVYYFFTKFNKIKWKYNDIIIPTFIFIVIPVIFKLLFNQFFGSRFADTGAATNIAIGIPRYFVTPLPFRQSDEYIFTLLPSIFHWISIPFFAWGLVLLIKKHFNIMLPLILLFILLCIFYGSFSNLQGPRHRVSQIGFIAFCQFLGYYEFFKIIVMQYKKSSESNNKLIKQQIP